MAPQPDHEIDRTQEYEDFINEVREYYKKRGINNWNPEPRVVNVEVDLLKLYKLVTDYGGYDKVSDEKLLWRKVCAELGLYSHNEGNAAFSLKTAYYQNLCAYEIEKLHGKRPPSPDILEHTTAKGGNVLSRTRENFRPNNRRETGPVGLADGVDGASGDDSTPSRPRRGEETPGSGRAARGLRAEPAQRVPYQPDTGPKRPPRHSSAHHNHPPSGDAKPHSQPPRPQLPPHQSHVPLPHQVAVPRGASITYNPPNPDNFSATVQAYEPRVHRIALNPVITPGHNPEEFARRQTLINGPKTSLANLPSRPAMMQPGIRFDGPSIYIRCVNSLRSGIPAEEAFALHHLVKISFERGDKFKFDQFNGLAEGLINIVLKVGSCFYDVSWTVSYDADYPWESDRPIGELDGVNGTDDILDRVRQLKPKAVQDFLQTQQFSDQMGLIVEAALTLRNMALLQENAIFLANESAALRDMLCIVLSLPNKDLAVELKHVALDIAEQITPYIVLGSGDPLYHVLVAQLDSSDRGTILTALRALGRVSVNLAETNKLSDIPSCALQNLSDWLLLNDDEFMDACLDFLYQYTAVVPNVENLLKSVKVEDLVGQLVRLLSHGATRTHQTIVLESENKTHVTPECRPCPKDLQEHLLTVEEPERCFMWLRCLFEEDPDSEVTQIQIWHSYNRDFSNLLQAGRGFIGAAEFIRNISHVHANAGAQIVRDPSDNSQKFIIKGIRPRAIPLGLDGKEYVECQWTLPTGNVCGTCLVDKEPMWLHVLNDHLGEKAGEDGVFLDKEGEYACRWGACTKYPTKTPLRLKAFMHHTKTEIAASQQRRHHQRPAQEHPNLESKTALNKRQRQASTMSAKTISLAYEETMTSRDERNPNAPPQAAGVPLSAVLILRNIARNVVKTESEEELLKRQETGGEPGGWNERLFRPVWMQLHKLSTENRVLSSYIDSLLKLVDLD